MPGPRVAARRLARRTLDAQQAAGAVLAAGRSRPPVRICWDLDNTLVDSGALLRAGHTLEDAVATAVPLPGMLELVGALRARLPDAAHVVLSARRRALRADTHAWLRTHEIELHDRDVLLVPRAGDKPRVWRRLARGGRLAIVDDLTFGHEGPAPQPYAELVAEARAIADVYLGVEDIARLGADPQAVAALADRTAAALRSGGP